MKHNIKEYSIVQGKEVDLKELEYNKTGEEIYKRARDVLVRGCNDVFIEYNGGILLVIRDSPPGKGELWPIGGGISRGVPVLDSLKKKAKEECGLELTDVKFLGVSRHFWNESPPGGFKGADELSLAFFAKGKGNLKLDGLHKEPIIVTKEKYEGLKEKLHPWVRDFMDKAITLIKK